MKKLRIDIIIPVYNEEKVLEKKIYRLRKYLINNLENNWKIIIAENGSFDRTAEIAKKISKKYDNINYTHINKKGRGYAIREAWINSKADVCLYMDVDLSTKLNGIQKLVLGIKEGYDIVIGSRYLDSSKVQRSMKRLVLSKGYNLFIWFLFKTKIRDMQCGFKAVNQKIIKNLLPKIKDNKWFFDTELLLLAQKEGYKMREIPVEWKENSNTKVKIIKTVIDYIINSLRLKNRMKNESRFNKSKL